MELEVSQRKVHEVRLTFETHLLPTDGERDVAGLGPIDIVGLESFHKLHGLGDAGLQLGEGGLLVG